MSDPRQMLDTVTYASQRHLGDFGKMLFFVGDGLQRATVDGLWDAFNPQTWTASNLAEMTCRVARQSVRLSRFLIPGEAGFLAWQEIRNKLEVFLLVRTLPDVLGLSPGSGVGLPDLVERAYSLPAFQALWAVEGVGHYYADDRWGRSGPPEGLLQDEGVGDVPDKALSMLHAGMGLAFADRLLGAIPPDFEESAVQGAVHEFVRLSRTNSLAGYLGAALESLGLVSRDFYPELVSAVDRHLQQTAPEALGFFWHGVGRALYFSRAYFLPVMRTAWESIDREASHPLGRANVMAGLAWAVTLVNMRQPKIMEEVLQSYIAPSSLIDEFTNGLSSSLLVRQDTTPNEEFVMAFYEHQPTSGGPALVAQWNSWIAEPVKEAIQQCYPVLKQRRSLGDLFRFCAIRLPVGGLHVCADSRQPEVSD
jgi:hypothetical protein